MNKQTFRLVFSKKLGMLVPVAECTSAQGKAGAGEVSVGISVDSDSAIHFVDSGNNSRFKQGLAASVALVLNFWGATWGSVAWAQSLPQGAVVQSGQASVSTSGNHLTVQQNTQVLGMTWQSFNIGAGNTVQFVQPSSTSVAVNQVLGNSRSEIYGNLRANGQVFLLNPNGVLFGSTAQVDVGALVASTASTIHRDANGQWVLGQTGPGSVINQGHIRAQDGGFVVLAGNQARNEGTIQANGGGVALAVGDTVRIDISQGRQLKVQVDGALLNALAENQGLILAEGGTVYLTAAGRETLLQTVVNNGGVIRAQSLVEREGRVFLLGKGGDTINSGTLDASGQQSGAKGGAVLMGGNRVALVGTGASKAVIDVSGVAGGGRTVIGGDLLGKAVDLASIGLAEQTVVAGNAEIRIGSAQGDGGFVETSGQSLTMMGQVNGQSAGKNGEWLIDPTDINISTAASTATNTSNVWQGANTANIVNNGSVQSALNNGTNVTITTASANSSAGDIRLLAGVNITKSAGGDATLTLLANRSITLCGSIASTNGALNVNLNAAQSSLSGGTANGSITLTGSTINTNGALLNMSANTSGTGVTAGAINIVNSTLQVGGGNIVGVSNSGTAVTLTNVSLPYSGAGNLTIAGKSATGNGTVLNGNTAINHSGVGNILLSGETAAANRYSVVLDNTANINQTGDGITTVTGLNDKTVLIGGASSIKQSGNGTLNINSTGLWLSNGAVVQTGNGNISISGSAQNSRTTFIANGNSSITQAGAGKINVYASTFNMSGNAVLNQTGNGLFGVDSSTFNISGAASLNQSGAGTIGFDSTASTGATRWITGTASIIQSGAGEISFNAPQYVETQFAIAGSTSITQTGSGIINLNKFSPSTLPFSQLTTGGTFSITQKSNGTINLYGNSSGFVGIGLPSSTVINQQSNGSIYITGSAPSAGAVRLDSQINQSGDGALLVVKGTASNGLAIRLLGVNLNQSANATIVLNGTSSGGGQAVVFGSNSTIAQSGSGVVNITANTLQNGDGLYIDATNITQTGAGNISITASGAQLGSGIIFNRGVIAQSGTGNLSLTGTAISGTGVAFNGGVLRQSAGGTLNITGTAIDGTGVSMKGATQLGTSVTNTTTTTQTNLNTGAPVTTVQTVNTTVVSTVNTTFTDLIDVNTTTVTNGVAASVLVNATTDSALRINQSAASGQINIRGTSSTGGGVVIETAMVNQSAAATLVLNATSGTGVGLTIGTGSLGSTNSSSQQVFTPNLSQNLATCTTISQSSNLTQAVGDNISTTGSTSSNITVTNNLGEVTNKTVTLTNSSSVYSAPVMSFNSSVANSSVQLAGTSNGSAGILVQGSAEFSLATGSSLVLNGSTASATAGPGVLVAGREISTSIVSSSTDTIGNLNSTVSNSTYNANLVIPVTLSVKGAGAGDIHILGTSVGAGPGVLMTSQTSMSTTAQGAMNITGSSGSGAGVQIGAPSLTKSTNSSMTRTASGTWTSGSTTSNQSIQENSNTVISEKLGSHVFNVSLVGNIHISGSTGTGANGVKIGGNSQGNEFHLPPPQTSTYQTTSKQAQYSGSNYLVRDNNTENTANVSYALGVSTVSAGDLKTNGPAIISAKGNLDVGAGVQLAVTGNASLSSNANISIAGNLSSDAGSLRLEAVNNITASGTIQSSGSLAISSTNGNIDTSNANLTASAAVDVTAAKGSASLGNVKSASLSASASGNVSTAGNVSTTGNTSLASTGASLSMTGNLAAGNVSATAAGNITASGNIASSGNLAIISSNGSIDTSGGNLSATSSVNIAAANGRAKLGNITATNLSATAEGNITASGNIASSGNLVIISSNGSIDTSGLILSPTKQSIIALKQGLDAGGLTSKIFNQNGMSANLPVADRVDVDGEFTGTEKTPRLRVLSDGLNKPPLRLSAGEIDSKTMPVPP